MNKKDKLTFEEIHVSKEFDAFVQSHSNENEAYWDEFTRQSPENKDEFAKAVFFQKVLSSHKKIKYPEHTKQMAVNRLNAIIEADERFNTRKISFSYFLKIAATLLVVSGLTLLSLYILNHVNHNSITAGAYNEIIVPSGEKSQVILADGTKVWLNSESKLRYPAVFSSKVRKVFLEGEGYFDVSKIKNSHFQVLTQNMKVDVLGTVFNIKSYPGDATIETTVVEGKVQVEFNEPGKSHSPVILLPDDRIVYNKSLAGFSKYSKNSGNTDEQVSEKVLQPISMSHVDTKNITCWKDQLLVFDNETFDDIAIKMSRWYKMHVNIEGDQLKKERFTGKFIHNETIYQVLEAINITNPIHYEVRNNEIYIKPVKQKIRQKL